jgi:hypothetical protein
MADRLVLIIASPAGVALWQHEMMARKKRRVFRATKAVKEMARERIGSPPPGKVVPGRRRKPEEKHKSTLGKLLAENE